MLIIAAIPITNPTDEVTIESFIFQFVETLHQFSIRPFEDHVPFLQRFGVWEKIAKLDCLHAGDGEGVIRWKLVSFWLPGLVGVPE